MSITTGMGDEISKVSAIKETECEINAVSNDKVKQFK
tara:strand:- start:384 stop:494 length:111 start_codon:yes stop_codon:yes gene_type:complete